MVRNRHESEVLIRQLAWLLSEDERTNHGRGESDAIDPYETFDGIDPLLPLGLPRDVRFQSGKLTRRKVSISRLFMVGSR